MAEFDEPMDLATLGPNRFYITDPSGASPGGQYSGGSTVVFTPDEELRPLTPYTVFLSEWVADLAGNGIWGGATSWHFTTGPTGVGSWQPMSSVGAPRPDFLQIAVWTGTAMVAFGNLGSDNPLYVYGGRYDPASDAWAALSTTGAHHYSNFSGAWTGKELAVWGGDYLTDWPPVYAYTDEGNLYDPVADSWRPMSKVGAPSGRKGAAAVWTGTELIFWGGSTGVQTIWDGGRYDPATDTWRSMAVSTAPVLVTNDLRAFWTGSRVLVVGRSVGSYPYGLVVDLYDPVTDTWSAASQAGAPSFRTGYAAVWTGSELLIWGGSQDGGACYSPLTDSWRPMSTTGAPPRRNRGVSVWTGDRMFVWGGCGEGDYGGLYDPIADTWVIATSFKSPQKRFAQGLWTGTEVLIRGGPDVDPFDPYSGNQTNSASSGDRFRP